MQLQQVHRRHVFSTPSSVRAAAPASRAVAVRAALATEENAGDIAWNKTYYPKLVDVAKVEKDWYGPAQVLVYIPYRWWRPRGGMHVTQAEQDIPVIVPQKMYLLDLRTLL